MSGFLKNIARRAAGLPAEAPLYGRVAVAERVESPEALSSGGPAEIPTQPTSVPVTSASPEIPLPSASATTGISPQPPHTPAHAGSQTPVGGLQRRAETPSSPPPVAASPIVPGPHSEPSIVPTYSIQQPSVIPATARTKMASSLPPPAPGRATMLTPPSDGGREVLSEIPKPTEPSVKLLAAAADVSIEAPLREPAPTKSPADPPAKVEPTTHETLLSEVVERIYASEPARAKPESPIERRNVSVEPPRIRGKVAGDSPMPVHLPEKSTLAEPLRDQSKPKASSERRTVNVRIGALELKLSSAPSPEPRASAPEPGFAEFEDVRMYRI